MGLGGGDACFSFVWFYLSQGVRSNMSQKKDGLIIFSYPFLLEGIIIRLIQEKERSAHNKNTKECVQACCKAKKGL